MNNATAIALAGLFIAIALYCGGPRYQLISVNNTTNPAVWKLDTHNGDLTLCATAAGKDTESGCSAKMKQF